MRQLSWTRRRFVAAVLLGAVVTWLAVRDADAVDQAGRGALPACTDLPGTRVGPLGDDPGWNGCVTDDGAAAQSHRYECSDLRRGLVPRGEEKLADEAPVVLLPDARMVAAAEHDWVRSPYPWYPAGRDTPFAMLVPYRCDELRSLPHDGVAPVHCSLDEVALDLRTTQGCTLQGRYYAAVGRTCGYFEFATTVSWVQWSIDPPDFNGREDAFVLESGPDEQWQAAPAAHRDERCSTPLDEWDPSWR